MNSSRFLSLVALAALLLAVLVGMAVPGVGAAEEPLLAIPADLFARSGESVRVPVAFANGGREVASTAFSIDFDESCLSFNPADGDSDGSPDSVQFHTPASFRGSASFDAGDTDGELDITIADFSPPLCRAPLSGAAGDRLYRYLHAPAHRKPPGRGRFLHPAQPQLQ